MPHEPPRSERMEAQYQHLALPTQHTLRFAQHLFGLGHLLQGMGQEHRIHRVAGEGQIAGVAGDAGALGAAVADDEPGADRARFHEGAGLTPAAGLHQVVTEHRGQDLFEDGALLLEQVETGLGLPPGIPVLLHGGNVAHGSYSTGAWGLRLVARPPSARMLPWSSRPSRCLRSTTTTSGSWPACRARPQWWIQVTRRRYVVRCRSAAGRSRRCSSPITTPTTWVGPPLWRRNTAARSTGQPVRPSRPWIGPCERAWRWPCPRSRPASGCWTSRATPPAILPITGTV